jgi:L-ascorbate metabolism protein UlaG (beta-lactamase superfamily)
MTRTTKTLAAALAASTAFLAGCQSAPPAADSAKKVEILWLGQSAFRITSPGGKVIVIDPWLVRNPTTPAQYKDLAALGKVDVLLVTHGHLDHIADAPAIAKMNNIRLYAPGDLNATLGALNVLPGEQLPRFNKSGTVEPVPGIKVTAVRAEHSSVYAWTNPATQKTEIHPGGEPVGYIVELENGFRFWHMGDTGMFADMRLIADYYKPDLVMIPIGGNFTFGPVPAAYATRELIRAKAAIPMHYGANPLGRGTPAEYVEALGAATTRVIALKPGEKAQF